MTIAEISEGTYVVLDLAQNEESTSRDEYRDIDSVKDLPD